MYYSLDVSATGKRIRNLMDLRHISHAVIAEKLNVSVQAVYHWAHGRSIPSVDNLYALSRILEVSMEDILVFAGEKAS